jgi:ABC-type sugar transport system substrate-binding protein
VPAEAAAAKSIGWTAKAIDYDGSVQDLNAKFMRAIAEKPTVIGVSAADPASIPLPLAAAKRAGIVVSITGSPDSGPSGFPGYSAASYGPKTGIKIADIMANWVMNDSKCNAHVAVANLAGNSVSELETTRMKADLSATCPDCTLNSVPVQEQQLGSPSVTNAIVSALQANPSIDYLVATLGNITDGLAASLEQAGLAHVKIVGATPDPASIKALQNGTNAMYVGISPVITGYVELDAGLRSLDTHKPVFDDDLPLTVLTPSNVPKSSTDIPAYPAEFASLFKKIWKVG